MLQTLELIAKRIEAVEDGHISALDVYAQLSILEKECKAAKEQIFESTMNEADHEEGNTFLKNGVEFTVRSGGGRYSYKEDDTWAVLEKAKKEREALMQQAYKSKASLVDDNGEVIPAASYTPTKGSLSIKKID